MLKRWELLSFLACLAIHSGWVVAAEQTPSVTGDKIPIELNGEPFTEYHFKGAPHDYFYPLRGPGGVDITRHYPMNADSQGEDHDHPHHRSLWFSHGEVNGIDFWSESPKAGKILHDKFLEVKTGNKSSLIRSLNKWVAPDGQVVCHSEQTVRVFEKGPDARFIDFDVKLLAGEKELVLGDTKEGSMAIRVAESMRLKPNKFNTGKATGHIVQSTGVRDGDTWGKRAEWCDYYGPVDGKIVGIAIFDHPKNPKHPTWWHVRDYGLFAANPFGVHDFEKKPKGTGDIKVPAGESITFRYRIYIHSGDEKEGKVAEHYQEYAKGK